MALSSKLIKDFEAGGARSLRAFSMRDIEQERRRIIALAEQDAAEIRALAQEILTQAKAAMTRICEQAETVRADAEKRGFEKGLAAGLAEGREEGRRAAYQEESERVRQQTAAPAEHLADIAASIEDERTRNIARARADLVELAVAAARKIAKCEINGNSDVIKKNLCKAIDLAAEKSELQVRLNPSELEVIEEYVPQLKSTFTKLKSIKLVPDMSISPGGCVVQTHGGEVDAQIETQLAEMEKQLLEL